MADWLSRWLGTATRDEVLLVAVFFGLIVSFTWFPRLGETVGGWFDDQDD